MPDRRGGPPLFVRPRDGAATGLIRVNVRSLIFFAVLLALIGLGGWLYLQRASEVASLAHEIRVLKRDKEQLHLEIIALRGEVAMLGSLGRVLEAGTQLGYTMPEASDRQRRLRVVYEPLPAPADAALGTTSALGTTAAPGEAPESGESYTEDRARGFVQELVEQLRAWIETPVGSESVPRP